jgi:hypothetical protein
MYNILYKNPLNFYLQKIKVVNFNVILKQSKVNIPALKPNKAIQMSALICSASRTHATNTCRLESQHTYQHNKNYLNFIHS